MPSQGRAQAWRAGRRTGMLAISAALLGGLPLSVTSAALAAVPVQDELGVVLASTQHWVGSNDVLLEVFDSSGAAIAPEAVPPRLTFTAPSGAAIDAIPIVQRFATYSRPLYRARIALPELGRWQVQVAAAALGSELRGDASLDVLPDLRTPPLGSRVPGGDTPTLRDVGSLMHAISSDPEPLSAFYISSVDEALASGQPFAFVLDSYAFRPNSACGGALGILHDIFIDYPALTVIHAEPWRMRFQEGALTLEPPGGPAALTAWSQGWGISEPPWVFVVDSNGMLHAKFTGVMGSDELRAALAFVTSPRPSA